MARQIRAKMMVNFRTYSGNMATGGAFTPTQENLELNAVASSDPNSENYSYSKATPSAYLKMTITNPEAFGFFEPGAEYVLTFEKAAKE